MFVRYRTDSKGKTVAVAKIYTPKEHQVRNSMIDKDALMAIRKLQQNGAEAYIVGGSVRDLLLGKKPKDFDIATSASPRQVQRLFWNSRIIGRRFRIVHLFFAEKIIEVTTFRSDEENFEEGKSNVWGTIEQDASRRDFSINALYYDPKTSYILDFTGGMDDMKKRVIRSLIPLDHTFSEDPVRMIRALKYQASTGFSLKWGVKNAIRKNSSRIAECSVSRLTEEVGKILSSGYAERTLLNLSEYGVLPHLLPYLASSMKREHFIASLKELDQDALDKIKDGQKISRADYLYYLLKSEITTRGLEGFTYDEIKKETFRQAKVVISPITPPNYDLDRAVQRILADEGIEPKKKTVPRQRAKGARDALASPKRRRPQNRKRTNYTARRLQREDIPSHEKSLAESHDD